MAFKKEEFISPMEGKILDLTELEDEMFSKKMLGDGFAVEMKGNMIYAPLSGKISLVYPTKHAYGIKTNNNMEILIHVGMDTIKLNGKGFKSFVKVGEKIKQGQKIALVDIDYLKSIGYTLHTPVIFTSGEKIRILKSGDCKYFDKDMIKVVKS